MDCVVTKLFYDKYCHEANKNDKIMKFERQTILHLLSAHVEMQTDVNSLYASVEIYRLSDI